jgi:predicted nucleic acid-binding protein
MTLVVDASSMVAALVDAGPDGEWARGQLDGESLVAPHLLPVEVSSALRRAAAGGRVVAEIATLAQAELASVDISFFAFAPFAERVWELRQSVSSYDAWYVALAEELDAPLLTLDRRLAAAHGPRCSFRLPA